MVPVKEEEPSARILQSHTTHTLTKWWITQACAPQVTCTLMMLTPKRAPVTMLSGVLPVTHLSPDRVERSAGRVPPRDGFPLKSRTLTKTR